MSVVAAAAVAVVIAVILASRSEARPISDVELQKQTESLPEVKSFLSKYRDAAVQFYDDGTTRTIDYFAFVDGSDRYRYMLTLGMTVDQTTGKIREMTLSCSKSDGINDSTYEHISENVEEAIRNDACLRI